MFGEPLTQGASIIHRLDPRTKIIVAVAFSVTLVLCTAIRPVSLGLLAGLTLAALAKLPIPGILKRLLPLNLFMLLLALSLPFATPGTALLRIGMLTYTQEGLGHALLLALKGNAIVLALTALLATIEIVHLGYALEQLRVPSKLTRLLLFTVRYLEVFNQELFRLMRTLRVRGFRPRLNRHTLRTLGFLVGMLLVHALDRSERILAAMKCRGFSGNFHSLYKPKLRPADSVFALLSLIVIAGLAAA